MIGTVLRRLFGAPEGYAEALERKRQRVRVKKASEEILAAIAEAELVSNNRKKREALKARLNIGRVR